MNTSKKTFETALTEEALVGLITILHGSVKEVRDALAKNLRPGLFYALKSPFFTDEFENLLKHRIARVIIDSLYADSCLYAVPPAGKKRGKILELGNCNGYTQKDVYSIFDKYTCTERDAIYDMGGINPTLIDTNILKETVINSWYAYLYLWGQRFLTKELEIEHICVKDRLIGYTINPKFIDLLNVENT